MMHFLPRFWRRLQYSSRVSRTTQDRRKSIVRLFYLLLFLLIAHTLAMQFFEGYSLQQSLWLTLTTITTVGYGDIAATTPGGQLATVLLMFLIGIFVLAQIAGEWIDFRIDRITRMQKGLWRWRMQDHILVINTPDNDGATYLRGLVRQLRLTPATATAPIQIFSPHFPDGLPEDIRSMDVVHHHGAAEGRSSLMDVDVESAKFVLILAVSSNDPRADSITLDILSQIQDLHTEALVIAECVLEDNRERFKKLGADAVLRPVRAYPELTVRAMVAPGTEEILENLFQHTGEHPRRYDVKLTGQNWGDVATGILRAGLGTPLGYMNNEHLVITNPAPDKMVQGEAIFVMVNSQSIPETKDIEACIDASSS